MNNINVCRRDSSEMIILFDRIQRSIADFAYSAVVQTIGHGTELKVFESTIVNTLSNYQMEDYISREAIIEKYAPEAKLAG